MNLLLALAAFIAITMLLTGCTGVEYTPQDVLSEQGKAKYDALLAERAKVEAQIKQFDEIAQAVADGCYKGDNACEVAKQGGNHATEAGVFINIAKRGVVANVQPPKLQRLQAEANAAPVAMVAKVVEVQQAREQSNLDSRFDGFLEKLLAHEGGFANHRADPGGATNYGITQGTYNAYRRAHRQPLKGVRWIDKAEVRAIYYGNYYRASGAHLTDNDRLAYVLFDTAVLFGVQRAKAWVKQCNYDIDTLKLKRAHHHLSVRHVGSFGRGWANRNSSL